MLPLYQFFHFACTLPALLPTEMYQVHEMVHFHQQTPFFHSSCKWSNGLCGRCLLQEKPSTVNTIKRNFVIPNDKLKRRGHFNWRTWLQKKKREREKHVVRLTPLTVYLNPDESWRLIKSAKALFLVIGCHRDAFDQVNPVPWCYSGACFTCRRILFIDC